MRNDYIVSVSQMRLESFIPLDNIITNFFKEDVNVFNESFFYIYSDVLGYNLLEFSTQKNESITMDQQYHAFFANNRVHSEKVKNALQFFKYNSSGADNLIKIPRQEEDTGTVPLKKVYDTDTNPIKSGFP